MRPEEIKNAIHAQPFKPFRLRFGSDRTVVVKHPEFITMSPSGRTVIVFDEPGDPDQGDPYQILDTMLIEAIEYNRTDGDGNGSADNGRRHRS